jgi:hypothetical protein
MGINENTESDDEAIYSNFMDERHNNEDSGMTLTHDGQQHKRIQTPLF